MKKRLILLIPFLLFLLGFGLRFWRLDSNPAGLYWEEVALGYDAYSIAKTGKDHHGNPWPIVAFESFGDYKPAFYFYLVAPLTKIIGLNVWSVRLPSLLAGVSLIWAMALLSKQLSKEMGIKEGSKLIFILAITLSSLSPWLIHFSRGGWESNVATALITWAVYLYLSSKSIKKILLALVLFALAAYTYHAARLIAPLLLLALSLYQISGNFQKKLLFKQLKKFFIFALVFLILISPLLLPRNSVAVGHRLTETGIFSRLEPILESNYRRQLAGNTLFSRVVYHRYVYFGKIILSQIGEHFNPGYLFLHGDANPRHGGLGGVLYPIDLFLIVLGLSFLFSKKRTLGMLIVSWILIAILPASIGEGVPHSLRTLASAPPIILIAVFGAHSAYQTLRSKFKSRKLLINLSIFLFIVVYLMFFLRFYYHYQVAYPIDSASDWQFGYSQLMQKIDGLNFPSDTPVYMTREQGRPAMYYWFFHQTDPRVVQSENSVVMKDQGEYLQFGQYHFIDKSDQITQKPSILVSSEKFAKTVSNIELVDKVQNSSGETVWQISEVK